MSKQAQSIEEQEIMMAPVSYGDPGITILDAFDRFEAGDSAAELGQGDDDGNGEGAADDIAKEIVVNPAKSEEKKAAETLAADDDGDIVEAFFKPEGDATKSVADAKLADGSDPDAFNKETDALLDGLSKEAKPGHKSQYDKFKELREQLKVASAKVVTPEVEKKLAVLEEKETVITQLNERIAEMSFQDAQRMVLNGPEYDEQCVKPASRIFVKADALAAAYEGDAEVIKRVLLEADPKKRDELINSTLEALKPVDKIKVELWASEFDTFRDIRAELLTGAKDKVAVYEKRRIEGQQRELTEHKEAVQTITNDLFAKYLPIIPGLADASGKPTQAFKDLKAQVSNIDFSKALPRDLAFAGFAGTVVQHLNKQVRQLMRRIAAFEKEDTEHHRADPALGGGPQGRNSKSKARNIIELADEMLG